VRNFPRAIVALTLAVSPLRLLAESAPAARPFASPTVAASLSSTGAGGIGQVTVALLLVLVAVFAAAWLLRRMRGFSMGGATGIQVVSQVSLGARERAVIVKVGQSHLLLGVAPGHVSMLHVLPDGGSIQDSTSADPGAGGPIAQRPNFAALLKKSLGR
jgi:flagellar protein FliO/FliZ